MDLPPPIGRLAEGLNSGDAVRVADAFTEDYQCEIPMHPGRDFTGRDRVEENWSAIFERVRGLHAEVLRWTADDEAIWSEWEITGTDPDGDPVLMRGVVIAQAPQNGLIAHTRFYLDPVTDTESDSSTDSKD